jgi:hypothetical protein
VRSFLLSVVVLAVLAGSASGHHALQAEFDLGSPSRKWTGTLKALHWVNPHAQLQIDVADAAGKVTTWTFETAAPNALRRIGFTGQSFFVVGKTYTIIGYPARDGSPIAFIEQLTLPDGRTVRIWFGDPNGSN